MNNLRILDVSIDAIRTDDALVKIGQLMNKRSASIITTTNTEFIMQAQNSPEFKSILNKESSLNLPDGIGILWAARFDKVKIPSNPTLAYPFLVLTWLFFIFLIPFGRNFFKNPIPEKISGSDFIWPLARFAAEKKYRLFLLGGAPTIAERAALKLQTDIYGLNISGVYSGKADEIDAIVNAVNKSKAEILLVAFGSPKQEIWLKNNLKKTCCKLGIGLGGTFDFIAGAQNRAPIWMQRGGLEWLYRLIMQPTRLKRQINIPIFMWRVLMHKLQECQKDIKQA
ncbi:MAG: WecB/TagA/CpsF family glycosyltransferase [bacterium]